MSLHARVVQLVALDKSPVNERSVRAGTGVGGTPYGRPWICVYGAYCLRSHLAPGSCRAEKPATDGVQHEPFHPLDHFRRDMAVFEATDPLSQLGSVS